MDELDLSASAFIDEVESYFRSMSDLPAPPDADLPDGDGWYVHSPSAPRVASPPWIGVSDVHVAYAPPAVIVTFRWTGDTALSAPAKSYALVLDGARLTAEKCTIRVEAFLMKKNWHHGAQAAGSLHVIAVDSPEPSPSRHRP
ncbi:hypothetical protein HQ325_16535 [Rhodococcus sp. BP-349]|uniref:hypothetical protein n=1 Tax=unclassified Rhodococcus (in: high G+C Gram-positive bacteria) TaxID=192944 RepID=UPI001C9AA017|nr:MULTISPECIES: hypothetical protein [unclassified Rhodococcus (in: high G+C Gram-positive bacteria)]MBY6540283.1 hypothetical protein [Rhodococcus sp. BP-363]MBY6545692.1 hypothetical protein [Rhodococcus sp. BP-369]MBY6564922.1 hypothetical protein [Rhodococcus sp. BP-370]MBY6578142.1 hypothetical protein [Rhodococcus sp. BP-364]MBY6587443.1 hypothetical protein [Rhodococcus sp. BP-358]